MSAKPYSDVEIAERAANPLCVYVIGQEPYPEPREQRWLATVDALKARLAAAEARAKRAVGLLGEARCYVRHVAGDDSLDEYGACVTTLERIDALLEEVSHEG